MPDANHSPRQRNKQAIHGEIASGQVTVRTFPLEVQFSTEHRCNLRCVQCGSTIERNHGKVPLMDRRLPVRALERFGKLLPALPSFEWLSLTGSGEPLISPDLPAILALACGHECTVSFNTNGTLWTRERAEMVVDRGVDEIRFSIDGACKETYERIRVNAKWEKVLEAIATLLAVRREKQSRRPRVVFSSNFMRQNIEELPALVDLGADLGVDAVIANNTIIYEPAMQGEALVHHRALAAGITRRALQRAQVRGMTFVNNLIDLESVPAAAPEVETTAPVSMPSPPAAVRQGVPALAQVPEVAPAQAAAPSAPCPQSAESQREVVLPAEEVLPPLQGLPAELPAIVHACQRPWTGLYVENDGWVKVCCYDSPPIGNLDQQSLAEIWNGPLAQGLRRSFLEDKPPTGCVNCFIFARNQARQDVFVQEFDTGRSYVDSPGFDPAVSGNFAVLGWAIEPDGVAQVEVLIDGVSMGAVPCDQDRPDVDQAFPGNPDGPRCGFRFDLDCSRLSPGDHLLALQTHTRTGRRCSGVERQIRVVV